MIKSSLKNFAYNFVYLFISMGIVYLFLLIAAFGAVNAILQSLGQTMDSLTELIHISTEQSSASVNDFLAYSFGKLDQNGSILYFIRQIINTNWISETIKGFFATINASTEGFEEQFAVIVNEFSNDLKSIIAVAATACSLGLILASFATRIAIRQRTIKAGAKKFIISNVLLPVAQALIIVVSLVLMVKIEYFTLLVVIVLLLLFSGLTLFSSWMIHKDGKLKLKDVLTAKNIISHLAVQGMILLINIVIALILYFIDPLLCVLLMVPIVIYSFNVVDVNTEYFVSSLVKA